MKIVVTGSLGNISKPLATELVQQGHAVTVISSKPEKKPEIEVLGANAAIGSVDDAAFLTSTLTGADAAYLMMPPSFAEPDSRAYHQRIGQRYAEAIQQSGIQRVVQLSSWGAHRSAGTGGILGTHDVEEILAKLPGIALTHLRPTSFYYNMFSFIGMIKAQGVIGVNYDGNTRVAFVHSLDIANAAAAELTAPTALGRHVRYAASDERTANEVAQVLGAAIGRPGLRWVSLTNEQIQENLLRHGLPAARASEIVDIYTSIGNGTLGEDYEQHKPGLGRVKLEDFAREFAAAYAAAV
ncbi:NmrA family NAD(P)-binding protein [Hymenobacter sp. 5317J-9]|uniref:NmrA family NAD(P)-binding protein n=1 Tax=Hymenobacter sp. 5317J-9 TaxID=2932250 RepID=UPI001FD6E2F1|nr:NmrA family NAD(P)-binding protein [Hymenobacter sp. 5317J-9]UOQ99639.1 NmrA family NAD(P)-binding protein [Hymenobacter sp. 5317J-9]